MFLFKAILSKIVLVIENLFVTFIGQKYIEYCLKN